MFHLLLRFRNVFIKDATEQTGRPIKHASTQRKRNITWLTLSVPLHSIDSPTIFMLCFSYLLRAEGLSPVVQNEPVFGVWLVFYRGLVALLSVCDFAIFVHGWYGPPATVGGSNIVGRRHDRGFCACERGAERERGREGGIERDGRREGGREGERGGVSAPRTGASSTLSSRCFTHSTIHL